MGQQRLQLIEAGNGGVLRADEVRTVAHVLGIDPLLLCQDRPDLWRRKHLPGRRKNPVVIDYMAGDYLPSEHGPWSGSPY